MTKLAQKAGLQIRRGAKKHGGLSITRNLTSGAVTISVSSAGKVLVDGPGADNYLGVTTVEQLGSDDWLCLIDEILMYNRTGKPAASAAAL